jgi:hypothetical protein
MLSAFKQANQKTDSTRWPVTCSCLHKLVSLLQDEVACLFARDDETYSYNRRVNRRSTIQEHYMIRRAIDRGDSFTTRTSALSK